MFWILSYINFMHSLKCKFCEIVNKKIPTLIIELAYFKIFS